MGSLGPFDKYGPSGIEGGEVNHALLAAVLAAFLALPVLARASDYYASPPHYPDVATSDALICHYRGELDRRDRNHERAAACAGNNRNAHAYDAGRAGR
jgi:hypothetical protein